MNETLGQEETNATDLKATPGRLYAEFEPSSQEYTVSMFAGRQLRRDVPQIPIATFYGPYCQHDAALFAAAAALYDTSRAQDMLIDVIAEFVDRSTEGKLKIDGLGDGIVRRVRFANALARMMALGVEVVEFCGTKADGKQLHAHRMPIREALVWLEVDGNHMTALREAGVSEAMQTMQQPQAEGAC